MKLLLKVLFFIFGLIFFGYVLFPLPGFPEPLPGAVRSAEDGDNETPLRRAYFTDYTREEVVRYYLKQYPGIRLNYPPEDSQTLIRDQTRTTFLEEIVQPFRGSVYVNGFEPKNPKDDVWYKGVDYRQKIIIRYVPSDVLVRVFLVLLSLSVIWFLSKIWWQTLVEFYRLIWKKS